MAALHQYLHESSLFPGLFLSVWAWLLSLGLLLAALPLLVLGYYISVCSWLISLSLFLADLP